MIVLSCLAALPVRAQENPDLHVARARVVAAEASLEEVRSAGLSRIDMGLESG